MAAVRVGPVVSLMAVLAVPAAFPLAASPAPITSCGVLAGTIAGPSYLQTWTFTGVAGEHVIITAVTRTGALDTRIQLMPPGSGSPEAESICDFYGCRDQIDVCSLAHSGTYTIAISDNGLNDAGTYDLSLFRFAGPTACAADTDGGTLQCDQTRHATISSPADLDAFQFQGVAGQNVYLNAMTTSGALDTRMMLYNPAGECTPVAQSLCDFYGCRDHLELQLASSGTYTLVVADGPLANTGTYDVYLYTLPCNAPFPGDSDGGSLACEQHRTAAIAPGFDIDSYPFDAVAGERIFLSAFTTSGALDTRLQVYAPGAALPEVESLCDFYGCRDQLEFVPAQTGVYTLLVDDNGFTRTGSYDVSLFRLPCRNPVPADRDTGVLVSDLLVGGVIDRLADYDPYRFYGVAGERVRLDAVQTTGQLDTRLLLYPPDGGPAEAQSLCDFYGCRDEIELTLAQTGIYTALVCDNGSTHKGYYKLSLLTLPGVATWNGDPDGGALPSNTVRTGTIDGPADMDAWRFHGAAGDHVLISAATATGSLDTRIQLYPPGSGPAEDESLCDFYGCRDQLDHVLASTGLYTIVVSDNGLTHSGTYNVSLVNQSGDPARGIYHYHPSDGQNLLPLAPVHLTWDPVPGATGYDVYFGSNTLAPLPRVAAGITTADYLTPALARTQQYFWRVEAHTPTETVIGPNVRFFAVGGTTDVPEPAGAVAGGGLRMAPARPNPTGGTTTLAFTLAHGARTEVRIVDLRGAVVRSLLTGPLGAGARRITWDGRADDGAPVAAGVYFAVVSAAGERAQVKLCVLR
jgi:flagellar hook capping protein FlgD